MYRNFSIAFLFCLWLVTGTPGALALGEQSSTIERLEIKVQAITADTAGANVLYQLANALIQRDERGDYTKAEDYAMQLLKLSRQINYHEGRAYAHKVLGLVRMRHPDQRFALNSHRKAEEILRTVKDKGRLAMNHNNTGIAHYRDGDYEKAMEFYLLALALYEDLGRRNKVANLYYYIGRIYDKQENPEQALVNYINALKIRQAHNDLQGVATSLKAIALLYQNKGEYQEAIRNYQELLEVRRNMGDEVGVAATYNNIGRAYVELKDYDAAIQFFEASLEMAVEMNLLKEQAQTLGNLGAVFEYLNLYPKAEEYHFNSLNIKVQLEDFKGMANSYYNIGIVNIRQAKFDQGTAYLKKAAKLEKQYNYINNLCDTYQTLAELYKQLEQYEDAYYYQGEYSHLRDSIIAADKSAKLLSMQNRFEIQKKNRDYEYLQAEKYVQEAQLAKEKGYRIAWFLGGAFVVVLLLVGISYARQRIELRRLRNRLQGQKY